MGIQQGVSIPGADVSRVVLLACWGEPPKGAVRTLCFMGNPR